MSPPPFFTRREWWSFWITTLISFSVYIFTLAPGVGLEDSGEFLTAAYHLGVPHPPGYPIWTISAFLFEHLIPFGNAAWRVNVMSAFYGALAAGMLCLVGCKLTASLWRMKRFQDFSIEGVSQEALSQATGIVAGLVFAFIETMWSQAVITEVYCLNGFFFTTLCLLSLRWLHAPQQWRWPCLMALCFGLGITNHQTLLVNSLAFLAVMFFADRVLCRDTSLLAALASAIFAWQSNLWFLWVVVSLLLFVYLFLLVSDEEAPSITGLIPNIFTLALSLMLGSGVMLAFCWFDGPRGNFWSWLALHRLPSVCFFVCVVSLVVWFILLIFDLISRDKLPWKTILGLLLILGSGGMLAFYWFYGPRGNFWTWLALYTPPKICLFACIMSLLVCFILVIFDLMALRRTAPFLLSFLMFAAGSSMYAYMPLASMTNPPMNWGYTRTLDGFHHHITRGQYERIHPSTDPSKWPGQYGQFFEDLITNFTLPLALLAVLPLFFAFEFPQREKNYLVFTILCFFFMGLFLVFLLNPRLDLQSDFINRVFYSLSHGVYSLWIGLGTIFLVWLARQIRNRAIIIGLALFLSAMVAMVCFGVTHAHPPWNFPGWSIQAGYLAIAAAYFLTLNLILNLRRPGVPLLVALYALPLMPLIDNWHSSEMRGHDFGWRFGHDMLKNLDRDAVVYGGTDPGRFVPTYMIFVESVQPARWKIDPAFDRHDLYIITQNALADQTYMSYIRDHYDVSRPKMDRWYHRLLGRDKIYPAQPLHIPNEGEFADIFNEVAAAAKENHSSGFAFEKDPTGKGMRASVTGPEAVFMINGAIAKWIFEQNKAKHTFYVEESYPIPWMYPYLEPAGLIMKLNKEPLKAIDPKVLRRDYIYWKALSVELLSNPAFLRDDDARRAFSKLRSAIAGLYAHRGMKVEAERTFLESIDLYPPNGEARSRLCEVYKSQDRFDDAIRICSDWQTLDPRNPVVQMDLEECYGLKDLAEHEKELSSSYEYNKKDSQFVLQYARVLWQRNKRTEVDKIINVLLEQKEFNPAVWFASIDFYLQERQPEQGETLLHRLTARDPRNDMAWYNLARLQSALFNKIEGLKSLERAIKLNPKLRAMAQKDHTFDAFHGQPEFEKLILETPAVVAPPKK